MTFDEIKTEVKKSISQLRGADSLIESWINRAMWAAERSFDWPHLYSDKSYVVLAGSNGVAVDELIKPVKAYSAGQDIPLVAYTSFVGFDDSSGQIMLVSCTTEKLYVWQRPAVDTTVYVGGYWFSSALSTTNPENWWTQYAPDILIYGALFRGALVVKELELAKSYHDLFLEAVNGVAGPSASAE